MYCYTFTSDTGINPTGIVIFYVFLVTKCILSKILFFKPSKIYCNFQLKANLFSFPLLSDLLKFELLQVTEVCFELSYAFNHCTSLNSP